MKGVILAGGSGSRLSPLTRAVNKHLLPVGRKPMIYYPIEKLRSAGIDDILVVTGTEHAGGVFQLLGSGSEFGCRFTYRVQDQAGGIAEALGLAEHFADGEPFCAMLGDNLFADDFGPLAQRFVEFAGSTRIWDARGMVLLSQVPDPSRFGVARFDNDKLVEIVEKPADPPSNWAVAGAYFYAGSEVFEIIRSLKASARGELEISDLNNEILCRGRLAHVKLTGWWSDAGTFPSLAHAQELVR